MALLVVLPVAWFVQIFSAHEDLHCTTASAGTAAAIDSLMRDHRTHVENVQLVDARDSGFENLVFDSGNVYVDDVFVGVGTWGANVGDFVGFRGWDRRQAYSMQPVNDLARAVSNGVGGLKPPTKHRAVTFSQHCVTGS